jgi:hypothetical protein
LDELTDSYPCPWIAFDFSSRLGKHGAKGFASNMNEVAIRGGCLCPAMNYKIFPPVIEELENGDESFEFVSTVILVTILVGHYFKLSLKFLRRGLMPSIEK